MLCFSFLAVLKDNIFSGLGQRSVASPAAPARRTRTTRGSNSRPQVQLVLKWKQNCWSESKLDPYWGPLWIPGLWIRIRMDPYSLSLLDPDPHSICRSGSKFEGKKQKICKEIGRNCNFISVAAPAPDTNIFHFEFLKSELFKSFLDHIYRYKLL